MRPELAMLAMCAMAQEETEVLDIAIEALQEYKAELVAGNEPQIPMAQVAMLMLKFETKDKSPFEAMQHISEKDKVCRTAKEMHDMVKNEPEKSN
jgi:hypothetical protein